MKKILTLALATIILACLPISCDNNDDTSFIQEESTTLNNSEIGISQALTWNLINLSGGFLGVDQDYKLDIIKWTFDTNNSILTVTNSNPENSTYNGLQQGRYQYRIHNFKGEAYLFIENYEYGIFILDKNSLLINQNITITSTISDGFIYKFIK
jgi:hypothetical protein